MAAMTLEDAPKKMGKIHFGMVFTPTEGVDTPGLGMICIHAGRIQYWSGSDAGEVAL